MTILYGFFVFICGSLLTSFYHVLVIRLNEKKSILGRSHCDYCNHDLSILDVFPIFGYLLNKGKCRHCKESIPIKHLIYEIIGGSLFTISFFIYDFSIDFWILTLLLSVLIIESISDIKDLIVIDKIWMIGIIPIIIIRIFQQNILTYLLSSAVLFLILLTISILGKVIFKKEALGGGDIKLYIFIGMFLTIPVGILSIFLTSLFGLVYGIIYINHKDKYIPLVPFISLAVFITYLYGEQLITWYLNLLGM